MRFRFPKTCLLTISAAAIVSVLLIVSCAKKTEYEGARISLKPERADFGTIETADPVAFHNVLLKLTNEGTERLIVEDVKLPQGFDYAIVPRNSIDSGKEATLRITMDKRKLSGRVAETAHILSNDSIQPDMTFELTADIVGASGTPTSAGAGGPDIKLDHKTHHFGTVKRSQAEEHIFPFENVGNETLKIHYFETTCLCLTAEASKQEIPPGESAEIIALLEPYKYPGDEPLKTLRVATNDPDEPFIALSIAAKIIDVAILEPREFILPNFRAGAGASADAKLIQEGAQELIIKEIEVSSPMITVDTLPLEDEQKGSLLRISIDANMPEGRFEELVTIITNYDNYKNVSKSKGQGLNLYKNYRKHLLPVSGSVEGSLSITPQSVNFGSASPGIPMRRKLILSASFPLEIESISISDPAFRVSYDQLEGKTKCEITLEFIPEQPERQIEEKLIIRTSIKEFSVPIFAAIRPAP